MSHPLGSGRFLIPAAPSLPPPALRNLFENTAAVQFNHRMLAYTTLAGVAGLWSYSRQLPALPPAAKLCLNALAVATAAQVRGVFCGAVLRGVKHHACGRCCSHGTAQPVWLPSLNPQAPPPFTHPPRLRWASPLC